MNSSQSAPQLQSSDIRAILADAIRYWEFRRIPYNLILAAIFVAWVVFS
jgi:hypothetical protein